MHMHALSGCCACLHALLSIQQARKGLCITWLRVCVAPDCPALELARPGHHLVPNKPQVAPMHFNSRHACIAYGSATQGRWRRRPLFRPAGKEISLIKYNFRLRFMLKSMNPTHILTCLAKNCQLHFETIKCLVQICMHDVELFLAFCFLCPNPVCTAFLILILHFPKKIMPIVDIYIYMCNTWSHVVISPVVVCMHAGIYHRPACSSAGRSSVHSYHSYCFS